MLDTRVWLGVVLTVAAAMLLSSWLQPDRVLHTFVGLVGVVALAAFAGRWLRRCIGLQPGEGLDFFKAIVELEMWIARRLPVYGFSNRWGRLLVIVTLVSIPATAALTVMSLAGWLVDLFLGSG